MAVSADDRRVGSRIMIMDLDRFCGFGLSALQELEVQVCETSRCSEGKRGLPHLPARALR